MISAPLPPWRKKKTPEKPRRIFLITSQRYFLSYPDSWGYVCVLCLLIPKQKHSESETRSEGELWAHNNLGRPGVDGDVVSTANSQKKKVLSGFNDFFTIKQPPITGVALPGVESLWYGALPKWGTQKWTNRTLLSYLVVSINGSILKMHGLFHGKSYEQMDEGTRGTPS